MENSVVYFEVPIDEYEEVELRRQLKNSGFDFSFSIYEVETLTVEPQEEEYLSNEQVLFESSVL
jgi:hypothetical protein